MDSTTTADWFDAKFTGEAMATATTTTTPWSYYVGIAALLAVERLFYGVVWKRTGAVKKLADTLDYSSREPEMILRMVTFFKVVQMVAFAWWYVGTFGFHLVLPAFDDALILGLSAALFLVGQILNVSVWAKIGVDGVCYGNKFGRKVAWCREFPYSVMNHPQYTGCILTVWGLFLPFHAVAPNNWFVIPAIETCWYAASMAYLEA